MSFTSRNKGILRNAGFIALAALLLLVLASAPVRAQTASSSAVKKCSRVKAKRVARKSRARCPGIGSTGSTGSTGTGTTTTSPPTTTTTTPPATSVTPPADPPPDTTPPDPTCPLAQAGSTIGITVPSACRLVASDTASNPDPTSFWGALNCQNSSRQQQVTTGGDPHPTALGSSQANTDYRQLTVMDGDDVWGARCEMGYNWSQPTGGGGAPGPGPTVFYYNGMRRATYMSIKPPSGVDVNDPHWRTVMQMKQAEPYNAPWDAGQNQEAPGPIIEMQLRSGAWTLINDWHTLWTTPARAGAWTRFAFDVTYSPDPNVGSIKVYADLNGDGDFGDSGEQSPTFHVSTLTTESKPGGTSPYSAGAVMPDHLRAGLYQDRAYSCPSGCSMGIDNVQVVKP